MPLLSQRHPVLYRLRVAQLRLGRRVRDGLSRRPFAERQATESLPVVVVRHGSLLRRRLGSLDPALQEAKIENLRLAIRSLDGLVIEPGETMSFWRRIGPPSARRGYLDGLVLRQGRPSVGTGGGLCQLANLLHWMALHTPLEVVERHHHSIDPFPDDRRALPFGSGAGVFYNYGDLRFRNTTDQPFQLQLWLTDDQLCGRVRTTGPLDVSYHLFEVGHRFEASADGVMRCNEIWRRRTDRATGRHLGADLLFRNRSRVAYAVDPALVRQPGSPSAEPGLTSTAAGE